MAVLRTSPNVRFEPSLDDGQIFGLRQRPALVGIRGGELLRRHAPSQLALVEDAVAVAVDPVEQSRGRLLGLLEIDGTVVVRIEQLHHAAALGRGEYRHQSAGRHAHREQPDDSYASRHHDDVLSPKTRTGLRINNLTYRAVEPHRRTDDGRISTPQHDAGATDGSNLAAH